MTDDFMSGSPTITIGKDSYRFDPNLLRWYCSASPSWRRRNIMCYMVLNSKLTHMAIDMGYDRRYFYPKPVEKKQPVKKARKSKSDKMFIKID